MSHFTTVKTKLKDLQCLTKAFKSLGIPFKIAENDKKIKLAGYYGQKIAVDILLDTISLGSSFNIGLRKNKEEIYELTGDFMGFCVKIGEQELYKTGFINRLKQEYSLNKTIKTLHQKGYRNIWKTRQNNIYKLVVSVR